MRKDIVSFIQLANTKYGPLQAYYLPVDDLYVVTKNGKSVQNFRSSHFYELPRYFRLREWGALIKVGLNHNMGERHADQLVQVRNMGKKILL